MKKHELNRAGKEAYWDLFVNRTDVYAEQRKNGDGYICVKEPLTQELLFDPRLNISSYQLDLNNKVKYAVLDIDIIKSVYEKEGFDINEWDDVLKHQAVLASDILKKKGIDHYLEFSGYKGYHVWIFFDKPVDAGIVKRFMYDAFNSMAKISYAIEWEVFPKQDKIGDDSYGNFVKAPLQKHLRSGKWSYFVDETFDLTKVKRVSEEQIYIKESTQTQEAPYTGPQPTDIEAMFENCAFLQQVIEDAKADRLTGSEGHNKRLYLANLLKPFGEKGWDKLVSILSQCADFDEKITREKWQSISRAPVACEKLCGVNKCQKILKIGKKSPIAFAYDRVSKKHDSIFIERNSCYYKNEKTRSGSYEKQISTFTITPRELLVLENSDCLTCDVTSSIGYQYEDIHIENVDWHNRGKLLKALGHQDCTFTGSENDLQLLCSCVNQLVPIRRRGTKMIGLVDDMWVVNGMNITKEGISREMTIVPYEKGADAFYKKIKYDDHESLGKGFYDNITKINEPSVIYPILGWFMASPLKSLLMQKLDGFPILFIHGG